MAFFGGGRRQHFFRFLNLVVEQRRRKNATFGNMFYDDYGDYGSVDDAMAINGFSFMTLASILAIKQFLSSFLLLF